MIFENKYEDKERYKVDEVKDMNLGSQALYRLMKEQESRRLSLPALNKPKDKNKGIDYLIGNTPEINSSYSVLEKIPQNLEKNLETSLLEDSGKYLMPYSKASKDLNLDNLSSKKYSLYELKIVRSRKGYGNDELKTLESSRDVYEAFSGRAKKSDREEFMVLMLDVKNNLIGYNLVSVGTLDYVIIHPREVFKPAILANAASIILTHNHPSGDPNPSGNDIELTKEVVEAGKLLSIHVLDHVIIGDSKFFSFVDEGII